MISNMPRVIDLFRKLDRNTDGHVSLDEFRQVLPLLTRHAARPAHADAEAASGAPAAEGAVAVEGAVAAADAIVPNRFTQADVDALFAALDTDG